MTDEAALLAAVAASLDDDTPRLVVADYYDDQGDADRAEFIRLQVALARLAPGEDGHPLEVRAKELLARHETRWAEPVRGLVMSYRFRRGFIDAVAVEAGKFISRGDELFRAAPVRHALVQTGHDHLPLVLACPHLTRLRGVSLRGVYDSGAEALAAASAVGGLDELDLFACYLFPRGADALARSPHLGELRVLRLGWNHLRDDGLRAFAGAESFRRLHTLDLSANDAGAAGAVALAASPVLATVEALLLRHDPIGPAGAAALAASPVLAAGRLITLDMHRCGVGDAGARGIAAAPWAGRLRKLDLSGNDIGEEGVQALVKSPHLAGVAELDLTGNRLTDDDRFTLRGHFGMRVRI